MKKITFLALGLAISTITFAQIESVAELGDSNPVFLAQQTINRAACDQSGQTGTFENGKSFTQNLGRIVAHDLTVAAGETFLLESININAFIGDSGSGVNAAFVDIYIYENNAGVIGTLKTSQTGVVPINQTVIGANFGFDIWNVVIDLTDIALDGDPAVAKSYWVGIALEADDASNVFWENSTLGLVGLGEAYNDGTGFVVDATLEGIYTYFGQCNALGVDKNIADLVAVYPNPTLDLLNVKIPAGITINSSNLVNILGANTGLKLVDGTINTSSLNSGVYILTLETSAGSMTKKIVK